MISITIKKYLITSCEKGITENVNSASSNNKVKQKKQAILKLNIIEHLETLL